MAGRESSGNAEGTSMSSAGLVGEARVMRQEEPGPDGPPGPLATLGRIIPFEPAAASDRLGWSGLEAARYRAAPAAELHPPALTHHRLILFARPPEELDLMFE